MPFTLTKANDCITAVTLNFAAGAITFTREATHDYVPDCNALDGFGVGFCGRCISAWRYTDEVFDNTILKGFYCRRCMIGCVKTIRMGPIGQVTQFWNSWETGVLPSMMPTIGTYPPHTVEACRRNRPTLAAKDGMLGLIINGNHLLGMYPHGLKLLMAEFRDIGDQLVGQLLIHHNMVAKGIWTRWPERVGAQGGWIIIDTNAHPIQEWDNFGDHIENYRRTYNNDPSIDYTLPFIELIQQARITGEVGNARTMLEIAKNLGFLRNFNSKAWDEKLAAVLAPMGGVEKVLAPRKTRVKGAGQ